MDTGIKVGDCMKTELVTIAESASIFEAAEVMTKNQVGCLVVTNERGKIHALITDEDLVRKVLSKHKLDANVKDVASKPLIGLPPEADLTEAARLMGQRQIKRLVVFGHEGKDVIGIISARDIVDLSPSLYDLIAERERIRA
ncbi:MAG: CBS domain-containing protein [Candidatus Micrarchaeota archaeon]|nr:CBS domain-containing protein [Candidatus Micrarchaeota archaeon]